MKKGFTLVELLVSLVILILVMALVMPRGSKMLENFQRSMQKTKDRQKLSKACASSFLEAQQRDINISSKIYHISSKGVILEKSNDNR